MKFLHHSFTGIHDHYPRVSSRHIKRLPKAKAKVRAFSSTIDNDADMAKLVKEGKMLWSSFGGEKSSAKSFWIGREEAPRCQLESFAQACAAFHYPNYLGAEYWLQIREAVGASEGLEFHFDKDEQELQQHDKWKHPVYSTVTYLPYHYKQEQQHHGQGQERKRKHGEKKRQKEVGAEAVNSSPVWGAPLVVFDTTSTETPERLIPLPPVELVDGQMRPVQVPTCSWVVLPIPGSHVVFEGNLLHGVPSELNPLLLNQLHGEQQQQPEVQDSDADAVSSKRSKTETAATCMTSSKVPMRMALAVNIWTSKPLNLHRLPQEHVDVGTATSTDASSNTSKHDESLCQSGDGDGGRYFAAAEPCVFEETEMMHLPRESHKKDVRVNDDDDYDGCSGGAGGGGLGAGAGITSVCGTTHLLSEHLEGHTSHLPLAVIRDLYRQSIKKWKGGLSGLSGSSSSSLGSSCSGLLVRYVRNKKQQYRKHNKQKKQK